MIQFSKSLQIRNSLVSLILLSLIFLIVSCGENPTNKAKEFMSANMYEQATALLEQEIQKNPKNATAHLLLGECKLVTGRFSEAQESFKSATVLQPDLGMKIGEVAISAANSALRDQRYNQAFQIMSLAQKYDPKTSTKLSSICIEKAKELVGNNMIPDGISFLQYALIQDSSKNIEISDILLNLISAKAKEGKGNNLNEIVSWCIQLDHSKSKEIGKIYFEIGSTILESQGQSVIDAVKNGFSLAIKYDNSFSSMAASKLYSLAKDTSDLSVGVDAAYAAGDYDKQISKDCSELLIAYAQKAYQEVHLKIFQSAMEYLGNLSPNISTNNSDLVRCLVALKLYHSGNRAQALSTLKMLKTSSNKFAKETSLEILSPPAIGKYPCSNQQSRVNDVLVTLNEVEVLDKKTIRLHFSLKNMDQKDSSDLSYETHDDRGNRLRIVDDNGKESLSIQTAYVGGKHIAKTSNMCPRIRLNPMEETLVYIDFPMISEGAHAFSFKAGGNYSGWQSAYGFNFSFPR